MRKTDKKPLISVIVPIYNVEKYLRQCVDSILAQTLKDIEIILVDDGSPDNCPEICDEYANKDKRIKVIHQKNSGACKACNEGISTSKGDYLWFVDADDCIAENACETLIKYINNSETEAIIFGAKTFKDTPGDLNLVDNYWNLQKVPAHQRGIIFQYSHNTEWLLYTPTVPWNRIHKREFIIRNNIRFDETIRGPYDFLFNIDCYLSGERMIILPDVLYNYRLSDNSTTAKLVSGKSKNWAMPLNFASKVDLKINLLADERIKKHFARRILIYLFYWYERCDRKIKNKFRKKLKQFLLLMNKDIYTIEIQQECKLFYKISKIINTKKRFIEKFKKFFYQTVQKENCKKIKWMGITIFKKKKSSDFEKFYFLGIPIYFKKKENITELTKLKIQNDLLHRKLDNLNVLIKVQTEHAYFKQFRNLHQGKDIVLMATGPTTSFHKRFNNAIYVGVNGATRFDNIKLDYLFVQDQAQEKEMNALADKYDCKKFYGIHAFERSKMLYPKVKRITMTSRLTSGAYPYYLQEGSWGNFAYDIAVEPFGDFCSTVFSAMQFILYTNPKRIYLVGCDCTNGYFYPSNHPFHLSNDVKKGWLALKKYLEDIWPSIEVISVNPVGLKGIFRDVYTSEYVKSHSEIKCCEIINEITKNINLRSEQ